MTARGAPSERLTRREFARALRLGLGRARIDVRRHGLAGREDLLVATCLRNPTRHPQLEGGLAAWLLAIAREGGATPAVRRAVVDAATSVIVRRKDREQGASILAHRAVDGDRAAGRALLKMVDLQVPCDRVAAAAIWGLGEQAWCRVVRSYGRRWPQARGIDWGWIVWVARREVGARRVSAVLKEETTRDDRLLALRARAEQEIREERSGRPEPAVDATLDALEVLVRAPRRRELHSELKRWARHATDADLAEAWRRLLAETDARRLLRRFWATNYRTQPTLSPRLFELARHADRLVRVNTAFVLEKMQDARIRDLALAMLREDRVQALDGCVLRLLERNALDEDAAFLDSILPRRASRETRDDWASGVLKLAESRPSPTWTPLVVRAMETTPCRFCRGRALRSLVERDAATESMLREALFDAEADTRQTAREAVAARREKGRASSIDSL